MEKFRPNPLQLVDELENKFKKRIRKKQRYVKREINDIARKMNAQNAPRAYKTGYFLLSEYSFGVVKDFPHDMPEEPRAFYKEVVDGMSTAFAYLITASAPEKGELMPDESSETSDELVRHGGELKETEGSLKFHLDEKIFEKLQETFVEDPTGANFFEIYLRDFEGTEVEKRGAQLAQSLYKTCYPLSE